MSLWCSGLLPTRGPPKCCWQPFPAGSLLCSTICPLKEEWAKAGPWHPLFHHSLLFLPPLSHFLVFFDLLIIPITFYSPQKGLLLCSPFSCPSFYWWNQQITWLVQGGFYQYSWINKIHFEVLNSLPNHPSQNETRNKEINALICSSQDLKNF